MCYVMLRLVGGFVTVTELKAGLRLKLGLVLELAVGEYGAHETN